jgi:hypothetical protein
MMCRINGILHPFRAWVRNICKELGGWHAGIGNRSDVGRSGRRLICAALPDAAWLGCDYEVGARGFSGVDDSAVAIRPDRGDCESVRCHDG